VGDFTGPVRAPLLPLDDAARAELGLLLEHAGAAPAGARVGPMTAVATQGRLLADR
jgi:hypothetical protein